MKTNNDPIWLFDISKPKALLVVAHADDETIFAGGLILCSRKTKWTIVCCNPQGKQRENEFLLACQSLAKESDNQINPLLLTSILNHDGTLNTNWLTKELESYATGYDFVLTHNREGEYGSENHRRVHRSVTSSIKSSNTWLFISPGSKKFSQKAFESKVPNGNFTLYLAPEVQKLKTRIFQECHLSQAKLYGYDPITKCLRNSDLRETLQWEFESGKEQYTYHI